jgi:plasmid stabilization system protein ParE
LNLLLDPEANREIRQAAEFYEDSRQGLGLEFLDAVESAFNHIQQHPRVWRILKGRFRRYLLQRFPYGLIYAVEGETIFVAAVMHLKRKPGYWVSGGRAK